MAVKEYKNDIFKVLNQLDKNDYKYFLTLDKEHFDDLQPYVLLRWMSAFQSATEMDNDFNTIATNEMVNKHFWELSKYKYLQMMLLCACGDGKFHKHQWLKYPSVTKTKTDILRKYFYYLDDEEYRIKLESLSRKDREEILQNLGEWEK